MPLMNKTVVSKTSSRKKLSTKPYALACAEKRLEKGWRVVNHDGVDLMWDADKWQHVTQEQFISVALPSNVPFFTKLWEEIYRLSVENGLYEVKTA